MALRQAVTGGLMGGYSAGQFLLLKNGGGENKQACSGQTLKLQYTRSPQWRETLTNTLGGTHG